MRRLALTAAAAAAWLLAAACASSPCATDPAIRLVEDASNPAASYVEVACIRGEARDAARRLTPDSDDWGRILDVRVLNPDGTAQPTAVAGKYAIVDEALRFTPSFQFDPGRQYQVRYYGTAGSQGAAVLEKTVSRRAAPPSPPTFVTHVYPSGGVVPENQLRMYLHFSAPMGRRGGVEHIKLLDEQGKEVPDPFLPLDAEFWNTDRTRYTVFFDPGRQKRGILPNRQMGPSLVEGRTYTLVVDRAWIDGNGNPLGESFTRKFRVGPPHLGALEYAKWQVKTPPEGTRAPLVVEFPSPLDHGLLQRAMGVRRDGQPVVGEVSVDAHETRWSMTPSEAWKPGRYELVALSILEDLAGNRIGRAFEIVSFERADKASEPDVTRIPFSLAGAVDPGARRSTGQ